MKKFLFVTIISFLSIFLFSSCFLFGRYMKSDKELAEHYKNATIKPEYRQTTFNDRKLHYAELSSSDTLPLLVMIHGAPGAWYGYMNLTDDSLLQHNFRIISVDRPGYGKSGYGKEELSIEMQALAIRHIIEKENKLNKKVYLLGRSYGAPIAAWLAIDDPDQFEKLVLVSPVIDPEKEKFYWFSNLGKSKLVQWMLPDMLNVATREKFSHQREMQKMLPAWQNLCTPTYVLVGEQDNIADTANFTFAKKHMTACPAVFMKLKETGHQITQQQPELIKQLLMERSYSHMASIISEEDHQGELFRTEIENTNTETSFKENPDGFMPKRKSFNANVQ
jgi:pimeloyl-ACP methyl ester carboxylesterase